MKILFNLSNPKWVYGLFFILATILNSGCTKTDQSKKDSTVAEKTDVKTYEIVNLISSKSLSEKYAAKFGTIDIELLKTSDSTLTFFVPMLPDGSYTLDFELAKIDFKVSQSVAISPGQFILDYVQKFDARISEFVPVGALEIAEKDSIIAYKNQVLTLFNSLSEENKKATVIFYEANKSVFLSFADNVPLRLNSSTVFRSQSDCPRTDFKAFYSCTAENLGRSASELRNSSRKFIEMMGMAGAMALTASSTSVLGPVAWGISAVGITLPLGTAGYLLFAEVRPAIAKFKKSLYPFLYANWVFAEGVFDYANEEFLSGFSIDLRLNTRFRVLLDFDDKISAGTKYFIQSFEGLIVYWDRLKSVLGYSPFYGVSQEEFVLETDEITITDISNPNVKLISRQNEKVMFKSLSGLNESFTYKIIVKKEGFEYEKVMKGKVLGDMAEVQIGQQTWMLLNLSVSKYRNGDIIPEVKDSAAWANLTTGAWCYHANESGNGTVYGKLYNWYAVNDPRGLAPSGWHIPSATEVGELVNYLGTTSEAGGRMKSTSDSYWIPPNDASNSSGFSAMGAGFRDAFGNFNTLGFLTHFWYDLEVSNETAASIRLRNYERKATISGGWDKNNGYSVRCIKD